MSNTSSHASTIIEAVDIAPEISKYVKLKPHNNELVGLCPFHNEDTPSFYVNPIKRLYFCFGCQTGGNIITFRAQINGINNADAIEALAKDYNITLSGKGLISKSYYDLLAHTSAFYAQKLTHHQTAQDYLSSRGISKQSITNYQIGYAPSDWRNLSQHTWFNEGEAKKIGLLIQNDKGGYDRFRNRIMFPILSHQGKVVGFGGRALGDDKPKYINSSDSPIYHKSNILYGLYHALKAKQKRMIVVEGYLDVISLHQAGFLGAVAALGTAFTHSHFQLLSQYAEDVVFCFDGDEAGNKAAFKAFSTILPLIRDQVSVLFLAMPSGEDPDSFIQERGPDAFEKHLATAVPFSEYLLNLNKPKNHTLEEIAKSKNNIITHVKQMPNSILRSLIEQKADIRNISLPPTTKRNITRSKTSVKPSMAFIELLFAHQSAAQKHLSTLTGMLDILPLEAQKATQYLAKNTGHSLAAFTEATGIVITPQTQHSILLEPEQVDTEIQKHLLQYQLSAVDQKITDHIQQISSGNTNPETAETLQKLLKVKHLLKKKKITLASS